MSFRRAGPLATSGTEFKRRSRSRKDGQTLYLVHWKGRGKKFEQQVEKVFLPELERYPTNYLWDYTWKLRSYSTK